MEIEELVSMVRGQCHKTFVHYILHKKKKVIYMKNNR